MSMVTEQGIPVALLDMVQQQHPQVTAFIETGTYLGETLEDALCLGGGFHRRVAMSYCALTLGEVMPP